ncbi:hypothetical protein Bpfe_029099 [Biomphalaria pfeifferi]|uniref:Secreted protein n=1 Tax=Biomphalaria pfeifferi TaxID=112525 RepID=A0AAD8ASB0_BIOPF|nr:hypothetical protein Bpfe_029099 [Biomphalaria pfeifferi]
MKCIFHIVKVISVTVKVISVIVFHGCRGDSITPLAHGTMTFIAVCSGCITPSGRNGLSGACGKARATYLNLFARALTF